MSTATEDIKHRIAQLSAVERKQLLEDLIDSDWQNEVARARRDAAARGIDEEAIAQAVHQVRYGR